MENKMSLLVDFNLLQFRNLLDDRHLYPVFNIHHDDPALVYRGDAIFVNQLLHEECLLNFSHLRNFLDNPHLGLIILSLCFIRPTSSVLFH